MTTYNINFTDPTKDPIQVPETGINEDLSIKFPGRIRLEWGKDVNENFLRMLENFASPSIDSDESVPDPSYSSNILQNPIDGQLWYNTKNETVYKYLQTENRWFPLAGKKQLYAANWGQVQHGQKLPRPVSSDGYVFPYEECIWSVSPHNYLDGFTGMRCFSFPSDSTVVMQYISKTQDIVVDGIANYLIIGIRGNSNLGIVSPPPPLTETIPATTPSASGVSELLLYDYSSNQVTLPFEATAQIRFEDLDTEEVFYEVDKSTVQNFNAFVSNNSQTSILLKANIDKNSSRIEHNAGAGINDFSQSPPIQARTHTFITWKNLPLDSYNNLHIRTVSYIKGSSPYSKALGSVNPGSSKEHFIAVAIGQDLTTTDQTKGGAGLIIPQLSLPGIYETQEMGEFVYNDFVFPIPPSSSRVNNDITITFSHGHLQTFAMFHEGDIYLST